MPTGPSSIPDMVACNLAPDRWLVYKPYEDPHIIWLSTHSAEPETIACGVDAGGHALDETTHEQSGFSPGSTLWVFAAYRDQRNGELTQFRITRPDGSVFAAWDFDLASQNLPNPFYSGTTWDWRYVLPVDAPAGIWHVAAVFQGQVYQRAFRVGVATLDTTAAAAERGGVGAQATRCRPRIGQAPPTGCPP